jgi:nicotinamidase-related amidase
MPLTQLDTAAALIVIDLQKGIVAIPMVHPAVEIVGRSVQLARAFRERGLPVVLVNVTAAAPGRTDAGPRTFSFPDDWTDLVLELEQHPDDHLVSKLRVGAFIGTSLNEYLRQRGVTQVFLTGIATGSGVEATARSAYDHGYNVVLVVDAMTDRNAEVHRHSVETTFPKLGETDTTDNRAEAIEGGTSSVSRAKPTPKESNSPIFRERRPLGRSRIMVGGDPATPHSSAPALVRGQLRDRLARCRNRECRIQE